MKYLILILFVSLKCFAQDGWFCEQESGKRDGNTIWACGMGEGMDEAYARTAALNAAIHEFQALCEISSDCKGHETSVEPKRTTCQKEKLPYSEKWKCVRLLSITIQ